MGSDDPSSWPLHEPAAVPGEDFSDFFNFSCIQLDLPSSTFGSAGRDDDDDTHSQHTAMDTDFPDGDNMAAKDNRLLGNEDILGMQFHDLNTLGQSRQLHGQHHPGVHHSMIPPTPSSIDLQTGLPHSYTHSMEADTLMDRFNTMRDEQILFTPLVSPAVTPLDTNFMQHMPPFSMSEYFSPLTSPALDAHQHRTHMPNPHRVHTHHSQSASPVDPKDSPSINRKVNPSRRKSTTSRNPSRVVRESPSMKPQRKKAPPPLAPTLELAGALMEQPLTPGSRQTPQKHDSGFSQFQSSRDTSSNESVSPEPLPDVLMPPPPRATRPSNDNTGDNGAPGAPATPASLMKLQKTNLPTEDIPPIAMDTSDFLNGDVERVMKDVGTKEEVSRSSGDEQSTPTIGIKAISSGSTLRVGERWSKSPMLGAQTPSSSSGGKRITKPSSRGGKRGSVCSSPALQPRISPSIKPLLPQGTIKNNWAENGAKRWILRLKSTAGVRNYDCFTGMNPEASALLLKSNYQNIVEGTHKQLGLSYPAELSTNLTSKRTSHKIAEQGRRNRINNALAEIAALLPHSGNGSDGGTSAALAAAAAQASKASTVESAIEYIKELQRELAETKEKLAGLEKQLALKNHPE